MDELADELGLDPIEFRLRNVLKTGMKNAQGAVPIGTQRAETVLEKARAHALWTGRAAAQAGLRRGASRKILRRRLRLHPAALRRRGAKPASPRSSSRPTGASRSATAARRSAPARRRARPSPARAGWAGRPMRSIWRSPTGPICRWRRAAIRTRMSQAEQDRLATNPRWTSGLRIGVERQQLVLLLHRTRPRRRRASSISTGCGRRPWRSGRARRRSRVPKPEAARWQRRSAHGRRPRAAAAGAAGAGSACARPRGRRGRARLQPLAMGRGRFRCWTAPRCA